MIRSVFQIGDAPSAQSQTTLEGIANDLPPLCIWRREPSVGSRGDGGGPHQPVKLLHPLEMCCGRGALDNGWIEFDVHFREAHPHSPLHIYLRTTGGGAARFNPNLHACGRVCMSILNAWHGRPSLSTAPT